MVGFWRILGRADVRLSLYLGWVEFDSCEHFAERTSEIYPSERVVLVFRVCIHILFLLLCLCCLLFFQPSSFCMF